MSEALLLLFLGVIAVGGAVTLFAFCVVKLIDHVVEDDPND